jgi:hypothetical protein
MTTHAVSSTRYREFRVLVEDQDRVTATTSTSARPIPGDINNDRLLVATIRVLSEWLALERISDRRGLELLGDCLYAHLFTGEVAEAFEQALTDTRRDERLRIVLEFDLQRASELARLPWEYLHVSGSKAGPTFVASQSHLVLSRHVNIQAGDLTDVSTVTLLLVNPQAPDATITDPGERTRSLLVEIEQQAGGALQVIALTGQVTKDDFQRAMAEHEPQIVHFLGHGRYNRDTQVGEVQFTRSSGDADWIDQDTFRDSFDPPPRLTFLQACEGARTEDYRALSGIALSLVRQRLPAVIGFHYQIAAGVAYSFTKRFYACLLDGLAIDEAAQVGRQELGMYLESRNFSSRAFGSPVVYLQRFDLTQFGALVPARPASLAAPAQMDDATQPRVEPCPNPTCRGKVRPGQRFCVEVGCTTELEACPTCEHVKAVSKACGNCGYAGAPAARQPTPQQPPSAQPAAQEPGPAQPPPPPAVRPLRRPDDKLGVA